VLQVSAQRDQRQEPLQAKSIEGAKTAPVQDDFDGTEQSDLEPRRRFATDPAPVNRHMAPLAAVLVIPLARVDDKPIAVGRLHGARDGVTA
jgi:hypothetical protein